MTLLIGIEILLDGALLLLISSAMFHEYRHIKWRDGLLALYFILFCGISRISVLADGSTSFFSIEHQGYDIVPSNDFIFFLFLFLAVLMTNSLWFQKNAIYTLFGTLAVFSSFIIARIIFVLLFYGLGTIDNYWNSLLCRLGSILLLCGVLFTPFFKWLREKLDDNSLLLKLLIGNTTLLLYAIIIFLDFNAIKTAEHLFIISGTIAILFLIDLFIGIYAQKRSIEIKRINMLEQYIPVIEELITQVRARQHEFNNRLLAISAAAQTASDLEQAKTEIAELTMGLQLDISEKNLLHCDSKITAGMIFSKIKYAEIKKITIITEITASLKNQAVRELDIVEIIGILTDNAIEASHAGDTIYIKIEYIEERLSISVSNPYEMLAATDFVQMFRRGFSTKSAESGTRGYGLANVKEIALRYRGKIMTRNGMINEQNYVTIGVLFS